MVFPRRIEKATWYIRKKLAPFLDLSPFIETFIFLFVSSNYLYRFFSNLDPPSVEMKFNLIAQEIRSDFIYPISYTICRLLFYVAWFLVILYIPLCVGVPRYKPILLQSYLSSSKSYCCFHVISLRAFWSLIYASRIWSCEQYSVSNCFE